jgi:predicted enzyme related to lactoylglutathione lyase
MSEREGFDHGVPCWVDHSSKDPGSAADFYTALFGWETEDMLPSDEPRRYLMCRLRGRDVAGISTQQAEDAPPTWNTYVWVDSADEAAESAKAAGGSVFGEPFDVFDTGRMAVLTDPAGAWFCVWEARRTRGAGLVSEPGAMSWNELTTRDPEGSKRFYGEVFGWQSTSVDYGGVEYTLWHRRDEEPAPDKAIGGMMPMVGEEWPADLPPHWMTYFAVEETDAAAGRSKELGGKVSVPPFDTPAGKIAVLTDPLGAVFSVIRPPG